MLKNVLLLHYNKNKKTMKNQTIKLDKNLSLNGKISNISINKNELIIESKKPISWLSAESIAKYLIKKGYNKIQKIKFKELY
jgi:hypothetical protein